MTAEETYGIKTSNNKIGLNMNESNVQQSNGILPSSSASAAVAVSATATTPPVDDFELTENFYINSNSKKHNLKIQVQFNCTGIYLRRETEEHDQITEQLIRIEDVIGSHCGSKLKKKAKGGLSSCKRISEDDEQQNKESKDATQQKDTSAYLYIYAYVRKEKPKSRMRTVRILRFRSFVTYEENLKSAQRWHEAINMYKSREERKPLLILLNPKSGSGKGRVMFQKQVAPVLKEAKIDYELVVTTHANFAKELMKQRKDLVQKYSGIVVASGDGLFYEVLNGMMERTDWRSLARNLPLGIIPCGSGNGLAKSIAHLFDEPYEPKPIVYATLTCISGYSSPLDVVKVELAQAEKHKEMYSFLSVGWGLIADIDIESEKLRSIGAPRFTLWSIHRLLRLRTYKGKVSYLPWKKPETIQVSTIPEAACEAEEEEKSETQKKPLKSKPSILRQFHDAHDDEEQANEFEDAIEADENEEFADIISRSSYRTNVDSWHSAFSRRTAYYSIAGQSTRSNRSITASIMSKIEKANAELDMRAPQATIPPLNLPLPESWRSEEGEFVMVHAAYTTHLASDCYFAPESKLNDGIIYLVLIRGGVARSQLLQFLLNMSSGTHLSDAPTDHIHVIPVTAFRIEPSKDSEGIMTVDGERVDYGPIQAEIFPGMINVMVPNSTV